MWPVSESTESEKGEQCNKVFVSPASVCVDGLHSQRVQWWSKLCSAGRPEHHGFHLSYPRAGIQRETVLLLVEQRQETPPHTTT